MEYSKTDDLKIPENILTKWQKVVNILADMFEVTDALITRLDLPYIYIFVSSQNRRNIFNAGSRLILADHYCEWVIQNRKKVLIDNSLKYERFNKAPEIDKGLIGYLGFPLEWPNGKIFGTICVHKTKEGDFSNNLGNLMQQFQDLVNSHLKIIYQNKKLKNQHQEKSEIKRTLSVLINNFPGMAYKCKNNQSWTMEFVSNGCFKLTGYDSLELLDDRKISYNQLIKPQYRKSVYKKIQTALNKMEPFEIEYILRTKDNREKWVWEQGEGVFNDRGQLQYIQGFITDITEKKNLQQRFTKAIINSILRIMETYDSYTSGHSENVANISALIAEEMGCSPGEINKAYWAGMIHDIGKLLVPLRILNKEGKLTSEEYNIIKKHPVWGYKSLSRSNRFNEISKYILYHHERWDGKGYPAQLQGEQIPLISQILAVADAWDAMCSTRSYRSALTQREAVQELKTNKGLQFSPKVVSVFLEKIFPSLDEKDFPEPIDSGF